MDLLVMSGGKHPYHESTPILVHFLVSAGHQVHLYEEPNVLTFDSLCEYDVVIFNTRRVDELTLTKERQVALTQFVGSGRGLICIHSATVMPYDWPEWHDVTGGGWLRGTSDQWYGAFTLNVENPNNPCAENLSDFGTNDERYIKIGFKPDNDLFLTTDVDGETRPMAWTRAYGNGRVMATVLGHKAEGFETLGFQRMILNAVEWTGGR